jgi:L1 cell adhesion molecule like protein
MDISDNKRSVAKLLNAAEGAKRSLTRQDTAPCFVESLYEGVDYNGSFMRGRFDMLAEPVYGKCKTAVMKFLEKQHISPEKVDQVLLIGGSSRMPRFQQVMKGIFPNAGSSTEFRTEVEPDEAIALGCAVQAAILDQDFTHNFDKKVIDAERLTKDIGFKTADGEFVSVIPKGTPIPVRRSFMVNLTPKQTSIHLLVSEKGADGNVDVLAEVGLAGIPADVKNGQVEMVFLIENDHIFSVTLTEKVSGEKVHALLK